MNMCDFAFHEPKDLSEVCQLLAKYGGEAKIIAGGTDLLVDLKHRSIRAEHLVSISGLEELKGIVIKDNELWLGANVTLNTVADSELVKKHLKALSESAFSMASEQIRNMGTIGGNIASAVPSADLPPVLIVAGASVLIRGKEGQRKVPLAQFFLGPRKTVLKYDELLEQVIVPRQPKNSAISYKKVMLRGANALAVAGVAAGLTLKEGLIKNGLIVLGAVAPTPLVAKEASAALKGQTVDNELFEKVAEIAARESRPIDDIRGSKQYRRELVRVLTKRALTEALSRINRN
jgi:carbon-monoxide dehydrogenase medium subunit